MTEVHEAVYEVAAAGATNPYLSALEDFGIERIHYIHKRLQQENSYHLAGLTASHVVAVGLRETNLQNIVGGGKITPEGKWIPTGTDRGWLQITTNIEGLKRMLASWPGCKSGTWGPVKGHNASQVGYVPTFEKAADWAVENFLDTINLARSYKVPDKDLVRVAIAGHNAGPTGAVKGYKEHGDPDYSTTHGEYSKWVIARVPYVWQYISKHLDKY